MKNCTGIRCVMQAGTVDPATCSCVLSCPQATPPKTNADRIRAATEDELIEWFCRGRPCGSCPYGQNIECGIREWLRQEA